MRDIRFLFGRQHCGLAAMVLLGLSATLGAAEKLPPTTGAFHAISVQNLDAATAWYRNFLNFEVVSTGENATRRGALLNRSGTLLELAQFTDAKARNASVEAHQRFGIFKLGFTTSDLDTTFQTLSDAGADIFFPIVDVSGGNRTFGIKDPEGNIIQFFGQ